MKRIDGQGRFDMGLCFGEGFTIGKEPRKHGVALGELMGVAQREAQVMLGTSIVIAMNGFHSQLIIVVTIYLRDGWLWHFILWADGAIFDVKGRGTLIRALINGGTREDMRLPTLPMSM